jgi:hypothetical protein
MRKNLNEYAVAAAAAGVAVLALHPAAAAHVVYTPASQEIPLYFPLDLDVNNDGIVDFQFVNTYISSDFGGELFLERKHSQQNGAVKGPTDREDKLTAAALPFGTVVGPDQTFVDNQAQMAFACKDSTFCDTEGPWGRAPNRYLGLEFVINHEVHYGWARLTVFAHPGGAYITATLTGYAYETVAGRPITTGQTGETFDHSSIEPRTSLGGEWSLGRLALGASD